MSFKSKKNSVGKIDLPEDEFEPKNVKERITIYIDQDILDTCRRRAKKENLKYQTIINQTLRESISKPSFEERLRTLENIVKRRA